MKKLLTLALLLGSIAFVGSSAQAAEKTGNSIDLNAAPQVRWQNRRAYRNRARVVNRVRIVRVGRQRYREVVQTRYFQNGRTITRVISRVRIR